MRFEGKRREELLAEALKRRARVAQLRSACKAGTYHVDSSAVAEALLRRCAAASSGEIGET